MVYSANRRRTGLENREPRRYGVNQLIEERAERECARTT